MDDQLQRAEWHRGAHARRHVEVALLRRRGQQDLRRPHPLHLPRAEMGERAPRWRPARLRRQRHTDGRLGRQVALLLLLLQCQRHVARRERILLPRGGSQGRHLGRHEPRPDSLLLGHQCPPRSGPLLLERYHPQRRGRPPPLLPRQRTDQRHRRRRWQPQMDRHGWLGRLPRQCRRHRNA